MTLDQLVKIRRLSQEQAADLSLATTVVAVGSAFAKVRPIGGRERQRGRQVEARANYHFTIHARTDLQADDYLVWNGRQFNIRFLPVTGLGDQYITIEAERGVQAVPEWVLLDGGWDDTGVWEDAGPWEDE